MKMFFRIASNSFDHCKNKAHTPKVDRLNADVALVFRLKLSQDCHVRLAAREGADVGLEINRLL